MNSKCFLINRCNKLYNVTFNHTVSSGEKKQNYHPLVLYFLFASMGFTSLDRLYYSQLYMRAFCRRPTRLLFVFIAPLSLFCVLSTTLHVRTVVSGKLYLYSQRELYMYCNMSFFFFYTFTHRWKLLFKIVLTNSICMFLGQLAPLTLFSAGVRYPNILRDNNSSGETRLQSIQVYLVQQRITPFGNH